MAMTPANQDPGGKAETVFSIGRVGRCWRLALAAVTGLAFFAPVVGTFASSSPATERTFIPPIVVVRVHPFENVSARWCNPGQALHVGPVQQVGRLVQAGRLEARMTEAMSECSTASSGGVALGVTVDGHGQITEITTEKGDDQVLASCAARLLRRAPPKETVGPGTLRIGFFMGHSDVSL